MFSSYPIAKKYHDDDDDNNDNNDNDTHPGWIIVRDGKYSVADNKNIVSMKFLL